MEEFEKAFYEETENAGLERLSAAYSDIHMIAEYPQAYLAEHRFYSDLKRCIPEDADQQKVRQAVVEFERIVGIRFKHIAGNQILKIKDCIFSEKTFEEITVDSFSKAMEQVIPIFEDAILEITDGAINDIGEYLFNRD